MMYGEKPEGDIPPPHPEGYVNEFIQPLFSGLEYNPEGLSVWHLPVGPESVNLAEGEFIVTADMVDSSSWLPPEATDNGDGTYTINSWPISEMIVNDDGTVTLMVEIGPPYGPEDIPVV